MPANYKKGRVKFEYETEVDGANKTVELPMRMIVTGDWAQGIAVSVSFLNTMRFSSIPFKLIPRNRIPPRSISLMNI